MITLKSNNPIVKSWRLYFEGLFADDPFSFHIFNVFLRWNWKRFRLRGCVTLGRAAHTIGWCPCGKPPHNLKPRKIVPSTMRQCEQHSVLLENFSIMFAGTLFKTFSLLSSVFEIGLAAC